MGDRGGGPSMAHLGPAQIEIRSSSGCQRPSVVRPPGSTVPAVADRRPQLRISASPLQHSAQRRRPHRAQHRRTLRRSVGPRCRLAGYSSSGSRALGELLLGPGGCAAVGWPTAAGRWLPGRLPLVPLVCCLLQCSA
jgi:hypothetical protein